MREPLAFICFDEVTDQAEQARFLAEMGRSPTSFGVDHWSLAAASSHSDWDKLISGNIGRCDMLIVLVGAGTAASPLVAKELQYARDCNVPFFGVYTAGASESPALPATLPSNRVLPWDWPRIGAAVKQMMAEGKNHTFR